MATVSPAQKNWTRLEKILKKPARMRLPQSLQTRLMLSHLLVSLVSIVIIASFAGSAILNSAAKEIEHSLEDIAFASSNALEPVLDSFSKGEADATRVEIVVKRLLVKHPELQYTIFLPDGTPLIFSGENQPPAANENTAPEVLQAIRGDIGEGEIVRPDEQGNETFFVAARIQRDDQVLAVLRLGRHMQPAMAATRRSLALLILVSVGVAMGVSIFGWLLANNLSQPIQHLTHAAEHLAGGDLGARVTPRGPQELHRLAEAFNIMAGRLQDHVDELRAFVANASHELRTPLTVVKLRAEALRDGAMEDPPVAEKFLGEIESEVDRLGKMVSDLLDLSRLEAGLTPQKRILLDMGAIATDVYETFTIRASKAGVALELDLEPDLPPLMGNEDQLRRVLYNFVENAIKYTPKGGRVDLFIRSGRQGRTIRVLIKDTGPGIAPADLPHIFERFYRVEATKPRYGKSKGSGLGLAIAKSIVESHGGKIGVSSQIGKGATFWTELPTQ
jgi:signal transduction histidine kinase